MPATSDYYEVLGVPRDATDADIKKAFRSRARDVHPDTSDHDNAEELFKELNEAYEVLSDSEKRANYDRFGTANPQSRFPGGYTYGDPFGGAGIGDLFSVIFDGVMGGAARQEARTEGRDMAAQVVVTLEEAARGTVKEVSYQRVAPCSACSGTGAAAGGTAKTCPDCGGVGQVVSSRRTFLGTFQSTAPCQRCAATGTIVDPPCPSCGGHGRSQARENVSAEIPAGVRDGQTIVIPGMGEAGLRGSTSGDLQVTVRVRQHEFLHRDGDDLHARASVPMTTAALGGEIEVPGLFGPVPVKVGSGTQNDDVLTVKGAGMPRARGGNGDLIVHANVVVPTKLSKAQSALLEQLSDSMGDKHSKSPLHKVRDWLGM
ncbi:MAG TPA: J domain-containing protein [Coriobacteriia bacterium]